MKVTSIELNPSVSTDACVFSFKDPTRLNSFNVLDIEGLGADGIVPQFYIGSGSGAKFYNLAPIPRELVFDIEFNPNFAAGETYPGLRDRLYKMIASSRIGQLDVEFKNGNLIVAVVSGFITKLEPAIFSKTPGAKLTINCSDGLLRGKNLIEVDVSDMDTDETLIVDDLSTAPHGVSFELVVTGNIFGITFRDAVLSFTRFEIEPVGGFLIGDVLHVSSEVNEKEVYLVRGGNTIHLADTIRPSAKVWPVIFPGENNIVIEGGGSFEWQAISYKPAYWGI